MRPRLLTGGLAGGRRARDPSPAKKATDIARKSAPSKMQTNERPPDEVAAPEPDETAAKKRPGRRKGKGGGDRGGEGAAAARGMRRDEGRLVPRLDDDACHFTTSLSHAPALGKPAHRERFHLAG